jgi:hypothetical protein
MDAITKPSPAGVQWMMCCGEGRERGSKAGVARETLPAREATISGRRTLYAGLLRIISSDLSHEDIGDGSGC